MKRSRGSRRRFVGRLAYCARHAVLMAGSTVAVAHPGHGVTSSHAHADPLFLLVLVGVAILAALWGRR